MATTPGTPAPEQGAPSGGLDIEGQIRDGVTAFMQSQDPAIAVEVVTMLAESMGIAPEVDPYAEQGGAPAEGGSPEAPAMGGAPTIARKGAKIYRIGGKIVTMK